MTILYNLDYLCDKRAIFFKKCAVWLIVVFVHLGYAAYHMLSSKFTTVLENCTIIIAVTLQSYLLTLIIVVGMV